MAKDVIRTRRYINKMTLMRTQIQAVSLKIQVQRSLLFCSLTCGEPH